MQLSPLICIVDDDHDVRSAMADLMHARGFRTADVCDAAAYLASKEKSQCQCVLADIQMPGMSGVDLKRAMSAEGIRTPVIVITGLIEDRWRHDAAEAGAAFMRKPLNPAALIQLVYASIVT